MGTPAAITSADGFMESTNAQAMEAPNSPAPAMGMSVRRSRRVGSGVWVVPRTRLRYLQTCSLHRALSATVTWAATNVASGLPGSSIPRRVFSVMYQAVLAGRGAAGCSDCSASRVEPGISLAPDLA